MFGNQDMMFHAAITNQLMTEVLLKLAINDPETLKTMAIHYFEEKGKSGIPSYEEMLNGCQCHSEKINGEE